MKNISFILLILSILILSCSEQDRTTKSTIPNDRFKNISDSISKKIEKGDIPSVSVAVIENGEIIWMESFGYADKENKIKATPNTLYGLASISKPITATGIMKLHEDGKIDLDSDVETYFKNVNLKYYVDVDNKVSCRNLLSHTAGFPLHFNYYYGDDTRTIPNSKQVANQYGIIVNPPSSKYEYANLGYGILDGIISEITGKSFNDYMTDEIFSHLGMTQTTLDISSKTKNKLAKHYDLKGNLMPFSFCDTPGAGNVSSTIYDLVQFGKFHLGNNAENKKPLLSTKTIQSMQKGQYTDNVNGRNTYGLGWFFDNEQYKYNMVFHAGGMDGVDAMLRLIPEKNIVVAALSNQYSEYTHELTEQILLEMLPDLKSVETEQKQKAEVPAQKKPIKIEQSDLIGNWTGHILTDKKQIPIELEFQKDGDIHVSMPIQFESMLLFTQRYKIQHKMLLNKWFFNNGHLMGWYAGNIPGDHLKRCPQTTLLNLKYKGDKLIGSAAALASDSAKMHYALSYYLELERNKK